MSEYKIMRWDVIIAGDSKNKIPMIYIEPDITFLEFVKANSFAVVCLINGTDTKYDNKKIPGVVDKSCFTPNCRPNFCEKTGWYVISLWSNWYGYPNVGKEGTVKFYGLENPDQVKEEKEEKPEVDQQNMLGNDFLSSYLNVNYRLIFLIICAILLVIFLLFTFTRWNTNSTVNKPVLQ